jgi:hypothetical protein
VSICSHNITGFSRDWDRFRDLFLPRLPNVPNFHKVYPSLTATVDYFSAFNSATADRDGVFTPFGNWFVLAKSTEPLSKSGSNEPNEDFQSS